MASGRIAAVHTDFCYLFQSYCVGYTYFTKTLLSVDATHEREQHLGKLICKFWRAYLKAVDPAEPKWYTFLQHRCSVNQSFSFCVLITSTCKFQLMIYYSMTLLNTLDPYLGKQNLDLKVLFWMLIGGDNLNWMHMGLKEVFPSHLQLFYLFCWRFCTRQQMKPKSLERQLLHASRILHSFLNTLLFQRLKKSSEWRRPTFLGKKKVF